MQRPEQTNSKRPVVLVLGRDIRAFLTVIRSLGRANIRVHVGMCPVDDYALASSYVERYHEIPEYRQGSSEWVNRISELVAQNQYDLIVPTHDESAIPIQIYQQRLSAICRVYSLDPHVFDIAFDKIKSSQLAADLGVRLPKQATVTVDSLKTGLPDGFTLPIVIKPSSSYTQDDLGQRREVKIVTSDAQLQDTADKHSEWGDVLIQEVFTGIGTGVEVLAHEGEILAIFQHMRVHEPIGGGASSYRKSVPINQELQIATEDMIAALKYTGVAMVEFKIDPDSGDWIFIEINGRFWGSLPLAVASGVDFPRYLFELLVDGNTDKRDAGKEHVYCRNLKRDLYWNIDNLKERRLPQPSPDSIPLTVVAKEIFRLLTFREHIDSFTLDDPKPGFVEFREIGGMVLAKGKSFIHRTIRNSKFVQYRNARKIKEIVHSSRQILFVCSGNICRSPFAEYYAKRILPRVINIKSCGFHERPNRASPRQAIDSAKTFNVDLRNHRSISISTLLVEASDIVFVFEEKNYDRFVGAFPEHINKVFFLGDLKDTGDYEIEDPYNGDHKKFGTIYKQICLALDSLNLKS